MDLAALFRQYGSDKDRNGYSHVYSILFDELRHRPLNVLEIGIGTMLQGVPSSMRGYMPDTYSPGASLRAWRDYFPCSHIYGVDVQPDTQLTGEQRITTFLASSTDPAEVNRLMEAQGNLQFDIIVDDGYHLDQAQLATLRNFFPYLKDGGLYIIEDIYPGSGITSNGPHVIRNTIGPYEHFFVGLKNNQCVIRKRITSAEGNC